MLAPEILERNIVGEKPVNTELIARGLPERIVRGPLTATNAGYVQLDNISEGLT